MKMPGKCTGPKYLSGFFGKWRERHLGGHDLLRRMDKQGEIFDMVQEMPRLCETENGAQIDELLQAGASGHTRAWRNVENNSNSRRWQSSCKGGKQVEN